MISMRGATACQEMERGTGDRATRFIWTWAAGERAGFQPWLGREEGFLCAPLRAEVLTEGPWPPLSRNSLTLSLGAQKAHMLRCCTAWAWGTVGGEGGMARGRTEPTSQPSYTTVSGSSVFAQSNWVCVPVLNEPLQRPQAGPKAVWGKSLRPSVEL